MRSTTLSLFLFGIISTCCPISAWSQTNTTYVVRSNFVFQGNIYPVDISLLEGDAPVTVSNFLNYVIGGDYNNLIINRSVSNFVIQGGAYTYDSSVGDHTFSYDAVNSTFNGGLQPVVDLGTITNANEAKLSNLRGTIAMALVNGQPDTSTNQWFINLSDNTFLDPSDSLFNSSPGFTVFGNVLGNGMDAIDKISALPVYDLSGDIDLNSSFTNVPLADYPAGTATSSISDLNLAKISSIGQLFSFTDTVEFGDAVANTTVTDNIVIHNYSSTPLQIDTTGTSSVSAPFSVTPCSNLPLAQGQDCSMQVTFSPTATGYYIETMNIGITTTTYGYTFPVTLKTPLPIIQTKPTTVNFGVQPVYDPNVGPSQNAIYVYNNGDKTLNMSSITFDTQTPNDFDFIDDCTTGSRHTPGTIPPAGFCLLLVNFMPADLAEKTATITINSDDPVNGTITIPITGGATTDTDGVDNTTEDAAPNNGDNNNDGLPDKLQSYVASFPAIQNIYTSLITDSSLSFSSVASVALSTLDSLPNGVQLGDGAFSFKLSGFTAGSTVKFGLILPTGNSPTNIYSFGPTSDNSTPHWYTLPNNASPGVAIFGNATLSDTSGTSSVSRNLTYVQIQDGGYGDSDMQADGNITFVGGPEINNSTSSGSISLFCIFFIAPCISVLRRRNKLRLN